MINNSRQIKEYVYLFIELIDFCEEFNRERNLISFFFIEKGHAYILMDYNFKLYHTQSLRLFTFFRYIFFFYNKIKFW